MITFQIQFKDGKKISFDIKKKKSIMDVPLSPDYPSWTKLAHKQCPNCPFNAKQIAHCPTAIDMTEIVNNFSTVSSIEKVILTIKDERLQHRVDTDAQHALFAVFFYIIHTSSCPHQAILSPLVKYIDPFPDMETMTFHLLAMYLIKEYLENKRCITFDIKELTTHLKALSVTLDCLLDRIRDVIIEDSTINSVIIMITAWALITKSMDSNIELLRKNFGIE